MKEFLEIPILLQGFPIWYKLLSIFCLASFCILVGARFFITPTTPPKKADVKIDTNQEMNNSPGSLQIGNVGTMTYNQLHAGKPETLIRLESEVSRLLRFPDGIIDTSEPPSLIEGMLADRLPYRLFQVLMTYDDKDVANTPIIGRELKTFLDEYYQFRQKILRLEPDLTDRIGATVKVRFRVAWGIYLRYLILRFSGQSKGKITSGENFLNYDITWDDAERVYTEIAANSETVQKFSEIFSTYNELRKKVSEIKSSIIKRK